MAFVGSSVIINPLPPWHHSTSLWPVRDMPFIQPLTTSPLAACSAFHTGFSYWIFFFFFFARCFKSCYFSRTLSFTRNSYTYAMDKCSSHLLFLLCTQASLIFFANKSFQFRNKHRLLCCPKPRTPDVIIFPKFGLRQINCQDSINSLQRYPHSPVSWLLSLFLNNLVTGHMLKVYDPFYGLSMFWRMDQYQL